MTEDEMVGWHHQLDGHEFEQAPGDSEGQGSLACCSPRGRKSQTRLSDCTTATTVIYTVICTRSTRTLLISTVYMHA